MTRRHHCPTIYLLALMLPMCARPPAADDYFTYAATRKGDLQLSTYITAQAVDQLLSTQAGRREALAVLRANGITKAYVEVYRGGLIVSPDQLRATRDFFEENGFEVAGGIATVPGDTFGVKQEGRLGWFNWQNKKTQDDLTMVMMASAPLFDAFIVDDFLCTADTSMESKAAKGDRSWSAYRMDLLAGLAKTVFVDPARKGNPNIHMIIKYPQWYDRFHLFGYDVKRETASFDEIWVGTETRNAGTRRFGYVEPYEGFVNYRWLHSLAGDKTGGAWFDHIECDQHDFIDQAYQSVLAGARELILFNYFNLVEGHPGHHLLRMEFAHLADLARIIKDAPVRGVPAYKPPGSDAGGDLYIMDYIGMLGIPLVPVSSYPEKESLLFLPTQAAADPRIHALLLASLRENSRVILTTGFLQAVPFRDELAGLAGVQLPGTPAPLTADRVTVHGQRDSAVSLRLEADLIMTTATPLLEAKANGRIVPYLTRSQDGKILVINAHTFSQADFDAAGEMLLCPRPLEMLTVPHAWADSLRAAFRERHAGRVCAPPRVAIQPFGRDEWMVQNYNSEEAIVTLQVAGKGYVDLFSGTPLPVKDDMLTLAVPPRGRKWIQPK